MRIAVVALLLVAHSAMADVLPRPDHIVIVMEENKAFSQIIGNKEAPYINTLAKRGVLFTESYGVTHPSQPSYLAFFAGNTRNVSSNVCPLELDGDNLASLLLAHNLSFASYAQTMPEPGYAGCMYGAYMRKHNPVSNWPALTTLNQPYSAFPRDFAKLPTVALVVPDQLNDMHDGSIAQGDAWLALNIERYARWAQTHNSLLIVTWDEDDGSEGNHIATMFVGAMVKPGLSAQHINHYTLLRMFAEMYGLPYLGNSADEQPILDVWQSAAKKH
jgi:acid phosphatase